MLINKHIYGVKLDLNYKIDSNYDQLERSTACESKKSVNKSKENAYHKKIGSSFSHICQVSDFFKMYNLNDYSANHNKKPIVNKKIQRQTSSIKKTDHSVVVAHPRYKLDGSPMIMEKIFRQDRKTYTPHVSYQQELKKMINVDNIKKPSKLGHNPMQFNKNQDLLLDKRPNLPYQFAHLPYVTTGYKWRTYKVNGVDKLFYVEQRRTKLPPKSTLSKQNIKSTVSPCHKRVSLPKTINKNPINKPLQKCNLNTKYVKKGNNLVKKVLKVDISHGNKHILSKKNRRSSSEGNKKLQKTTDSFCFDSFRVQTPNAHARVLNKHILSKNNNRNLRFYEKLRGYKK